MLPNVADRIELVAMPDDPDPVAPGTRGTVTSVNPDPKWGQINVRWDSGRTLSLVPGVDSYRIIGNESPRRARR